MVTTMQLCDHLGVEREWYANDASVKYAVDSALLVGVLGLFGSVGVHPDLLDDARAERLIKAAATDAYEQRQETDTRTTAKKLYTQVARIDQDMLIQLRCEYSYPQEMGIEEVDFDAFEQELQQAAESEQDDSIERAVYIAAKAYVARYAAVHGGAS